MDQREIETKLKKIINEEVETKEINPRTSFEEMGFDSLRLISLVHGAEETFGIDISDDDAESLATYGDTVRYICERLKITYTKAYNQENTENPRATSPLTPIQDHILPGMH